MSRPSFANLPLEPGTRLNRYAVGRRLSAGGFGVVYQATRDDGHPVAIKEFLPSVIDCRTRPGTPAIQVEPGATARRFQEGLEAFFREAHTLMRLDNPRIIQVWDVFEANGTAYFAMPQEKGATLQTAVRQRPSSFSDGALQAIFLEAAMGVHALHAHGLYHLDIKPSNLWLRPDGGVIVLDLGASRWQDEEGQASQLARTPGFAAPEQHGCKHADRLGAATDVYGLSATLYAAMEGTPPLPAPQRYEGQPTLAQVRRGQRDPRLLALVDRGMALQPEDRWPDVGAWRLALERMLRLGCRSPEFRARPFAPCGRG